MAVFLRYGQKILKNGRILLYDSTIKAIGFDEIRVRYRQQRRALIRDIILNQI
jgi:hypothetical protein